jgi:hypothetical protein
MSILAAAQKDHSLQPQKRVVPADTQQVCIDLPGEDVRCVVHKPKLEIMLRKHRDVIFDIQIFKGMTYTVSADRSDFYNARDKKIVLRARKQSAVFKDGERFHLWISRDFKGQLVLKGSNGQVLGRYDPRKLDLAKYNDDPKTKPAPLIVMLKTSSSPASLSHASGTPATQRQQCSPDDVLGIDRWTIKPVPLAFGLDAWTPIARGRPVTLPPEQHPTVAVVDSNSTNMPQKILDFFAAGGGKSGLADLDLNEVMTRNWLLGQLAGTAAYAGDNWNWLRHSITRQADGVFRLVSAKVAYVRGKVRIYFTGYSASNPAFGPGGHGPGHAKVLQIYAGVGKASSAFKATAAAVGGTFKSNALVSFIFGTMTAWTEWQSDAQKDGHDFCAAVITSIVKSLVAAALVAAIVALIVLFLMVVLEVAVAALVVGLLTLGLGLAVGYAIEALDKKAGKAWKGESNGDGTAAGIAPWLRGIGKWLGETWDHLNAHSPKDYQPWAVL